MAAWLNENFAARNTRKNSKLVKRNAIHVGSVEHTLQITKVIIWVLIYIEKCFLLFSLLRREGHAATLLRFLEDGKVYHEILKLN